MKKLLFVISQLYKGGAETSLVNLLNNLNYNNYEVDLLILCQTPAPEAVSLIPLVNKNVRICDAYSKYQKLSVLSRAKAKFLYTSEQKTAFYLPALQFVHNKIYDWAFFIGEWYSPAFVAYHVNAKSKAAWIHCDLSKTQNFDKELYFHFYECFNFFIFASKNALIESVNKYPFLKDKAVTIYNVNDIKYIKKRAEEKVSDYEFDNNIRIPTLITCANFRPEKNHIRQVKVLSELKKRGINLKWVNIGSTSNEKLVNEIKSLAIKEDVNDRFIILGPKENPYKYMKYADAITVLSDYESWSMVITEAKILGIPVISTKTAGALEQINHNETGILTDFEVSNIADEIQRFLTQSGLPEKIKYNIGHFDNTDNILTSFDELVNNCQSNDNNDVLYAIDDISYKGGAHSATIYQIKELINQGRKVTIFSRTVPTCDIRNEMPGVKFLSWRDITQYKLYHSRLLWCICNKSISKADKYYRSNISFNAIVKKEKDILENKIYPLVKEIFSSYNIVCVMSEASLFRKYVAEANCKCKIQWIHTDYVAWSEFNDWTREITKNDEKIYSRFDYIILLSDTIRNKFVEKYPDFTKKTKVVKNIIPINEIITKSRIIEPSFPPVYFISVGRLSEEKNFERLIKILERLHNEGFQFKWDIIGDGPLKLHLNILIEQSGLEKFVSILGHKSNPYPYISKAQVFALLSNYEGMPNTIYEALILGVPVLATNVGGICEQIMKGETGWLVENNEQSIYEGIKYILEHQNDIETFKINLKQYMHDSELTYNQILDIFTIKDN